MSTKRKLIILAAAAALVGTFIAIGSVAQAAPGTEAVSGNFTDTAIDTNDDGMQANLINGATKGRGGATYQGIWEVSFGPPTGACEPGEVEGEVVAYSIVRRFANGDLQYSALDPVEKGSLCFDTTIGLSTLTINANVIGGTGKYANASGSYTAEYVVRQLLPDPMGGIAHGAFSGTVTSS